MDDQENKVSQKQKLLLTGKQTSETQDLFGLASLKTAVEICHVLLIYGGSL